jgi:hypothetical protein
LKLVAKNSDLYVKRATIATLKEAAGVVALVPAARVYPLQRPDDPVWPFIGYGVPITEPFGASCLEGSASSIAIHDYAQTEGEGPATTSGEDTAMQINAAIEAALDGTTIDLAAYGCPYPATAHYTCVGSQVIQDGSEADKFHGFVSFRIVVSS